MRKTKSKSTRRLSTYRPVLEGLEDRLAPATITWPVPDSHEMINGFGQGMPAIQEKFHGGIDIRADGKGGQPVVAARTGKVLWNNPNFSGGMVTVEVTLPTGAKEYDYYIHVNPITAPAAGKMIAIGKPIGNISKTYFKGVGQHHLHFSVLNAPPPENKAPDENTYLNPLQRFDAPADFDPLQNRPGLIDTNDDGATLLVTKSGQPDEVFDAKTPVSGHVDLIADAVDSMSSNLKFSANPYEIGYYIVPKFKMGVKAHGVKSAGHPYLLAKFNDNWFKGTSNVKTSLRMPAVYDKSRAADQGGLPWTELANFIVTNTKGEDGSIGNVNAGEFWNTSAVEDNGPDTSDYANYSTEDDATKAKDARFPDGDYEIHIFLGDLNWDHNVDVNTGKVRVENFKRMVKLQPNGPAQAAPGGITQAVYDTADTTPFINFNPAAMYASPLSTANFAVGDMIDVGGTGVTNYYPNLLMDVYVEPHRMWNQGDSLTSSAIYHSLVQSDSDGSIPLTELWQASQSGTYDVIIDYDNDGRFSSYLDGLSAFSVGGPTTPPALSINNVTQPEGTSGTSQFT